MKGALEWSFLLYLENKWIIGKVPFFRSLFDDGDMLYFEQAQTCHIFHIVCFNSLVWNP